MLNTFNLHPFAISNLLIVLTCFPLALFLILYGKTKLSTLYSLDVISIGIWGLGAFMASSSKNSLSAYNWWFISYAGVLFIPVFFLHVVFLLTSTSNKSLLFFSYFQGIVFLILMINGAVFKDLKFMFNSFYYIQGGIVFFVSFLIWVCFAFIGPFLLAKFYINKRDKQYLLFLLAKTFGFGGGVMNFLPVFNLNIYPYGNFLIPFYVVILAYIIFKYSFFNVKIIIQKSFVYSVLAACIASFYLIFVFLTEYFLKGVIGYSSILVSIFYAFVIALLFNPLKNRIQGMADQIFLGKTPLQISQENELLKQELEKSERLKAVAALASGMAHEIKNPLTALKTFSEYLPEKIKDPEFLAKFSKIVGTEVGRIDNLVHQLLEFAKPAPLKLEEVDIHKLLDDTLELLSNDLIKHSIKVVKDFNADTRESVDADIRGLSNADGRGLNIPASPAGGRENPQEISGNPRQDVNPSLTMKIDPNRMKQAFLNLFLNAIDAMLSGGTLTVSTSIRENQRGEKSLPCRQAGVSICVKDTGTGIPDKLLPHIFEPFHSTKEKGTGLGLSITYGIIKEHKGSIKVESKLNEGTGFAVELPIT